MEDSEGWEKAQGEIEKKNNKVIKFQAYQKNKVIKNSHTRNNRLSKNSNTRKIPYLIIVILGKKSHKKQSYKE